MRGEGGLGYRLDKMWEPLPSTDKGQDNFSLQEINSAIAVRILCNR